MIHIDEVYNYNWSDRDKPAKLEAMLQPGSAIYILDGRNKKCEIRAIVDDNQIVCRTESSKTGYNYVVHSCYYFCLLMAEGLLSKD